jgi:hypothetical protein
MTASSFCVHSARRRILTGTVIQSRACEAKNLTQRDEHAQERFFAAR